MELLGFTLNERPGRLAVEYRPNDSIEKSGFDMFDPSDFDPALAIGYPTLRAWVHDYEGTGYRTASAFVQWIDTERRRADAVTARELDTSAVLRDQEVPFFSYGYPANIYDAPAQNMQDAAWMSWIATTWFVTMPARWTNQEVRPLLGFQWGYEEDHANVNTMPLRHLAGEAWNRSLNWLRSSSPAFLFAEFSSA